MSVEKPKKDYTQVKLDAVDDALNKEASEAKDYIDGKLSPYIEKSDAWKWKSADFYKAIENIYIKTIDPIKEEIRNRSRTELQGLKEEIKGGKSAEKTPAKGAEELTEEAWRKLKELTTTLKGWINAITMSVDPKGNEKEKIALEVFQELVRTLPSIEMLAREEDKMRNIFDKLISPPRRGEKTRLNKDDHGEIVKRLKPKSLQKGNREKLEGALSGVFIAAMNPYERMQFAREFVKQKPKEAEKFIEAMVSTNILTIAQGKQLFEENRLGKFDEKRMKKYQEEVGKVMERSAKALKANYYDNPARKYLDIKHVGYVAMGAWGAITAALNVAAYAWQGDWAGLAANEWLWLSGAAVAGSASGISGKGLRALLTKPGTKPKTKERTSENEGKLGDLLMSYPEIEKYMSEGGIEDCFAFRREQKDQKKFIKELLPNLKEKARGSKEKQKHLTASLQKYGEPKIAEKITQTIYLSEALHIENKEELKRRTNSYKEIYGL